MPGLLRAFQRGRHTSRQAEWVAAGRALFEREHVPVTARVRSFRIPGQFAYGKRVFLTGSVMLAPEVVSASLASRTLLVWMPWAPVPADAQGAAELRPDGLRVRFDVPRIVDGGRGEVELHYRFTASPALVHSIPHPTAPLRVEAAAFARISWDHLGS